MNRAIVPLLTLAALSQAADAQWLECSASMIAHPAELASPPVPGDLTGVSGDRVGVTASFLFSTTSPPIAVTGHFVAFAVADFDACVTDLGANPDPSRTLDPSNANALIVYYFENDVLAFTISNTDDSFSLSITRPSGPFSASMTSLPLVPSQYSFDGRPDDEVVATFLGPLMPEAADARWSPTNQYGPGETVAYMVGFAEAPEPAPCSEVDLAAPFGLLNFTDIIAFLTAFGAGCP
ncbi:MAG: hypothetical protein ACIARR_13105 [Phycisphaerales bacterium JB059]